MRNLGTMLLAIVVGNLVYWWAWPRLPYAMQHRNFDIDYGLGVLFLACVVAYTIIDAFLRPKAEKD